ncbi:MAG: 2-oxo acid dehydrogenase subunit E2, partial [Chloroflexi bacterium]
MAEQLMMPKLGFDMAEGRLIEWKIKVGDQVKKGDVIADIETDKATIEIEAAAGGKVLELLAQPNDVVAVGSPIATVGAEGEEVSSAQPGGDQQQKSEGRAEVPAEDAPADKATASTQTRTTEVMAEAQRGGQPGPTPPPTPEQVSGTQPPLNVQHGGDGEVRGGNGDYPGGIKASPVARRLADERGLDLRQVKGSGPGGRIIRRDVEDFPTEEAPAAPVEGQPAAAPQRQATAPIPAPSAMPAPTFGEIPSGPDVEVMDISKLRRRIGQRMVESKQQVPHFYVTSDIDVAPLLDLRKRMNEFADEEHKISVNDLIVKAAALTLRQFPNLNTHFYGDKVVIHKRIHIGI